MLKLLLLLLPLLLSAQGSSSFLSLPAPSEILEYLSDVIEGDIGSAISDAACLAWMAPFRAELNPIPLVGNGMGGCVDNIAREDHISGVPHKYMNTCGAFKGQNECFRLTPNWNFSWCFQQWINQRDQHLINLRDASSVSCGYYWDGSTYTLTAFYR